MIIWLFWVSGWLSGKLIMPGPDGGGVIVTIILGIGRRGGRWFIGSLLGYPMVSSFDNIGSSIPSFIFSVIGAIVVLAIYRLATGRSLRA